MKTRTKVHNPSSHKKKSSNTDSYLGLYMGIWGFLGFGFIGLIMNVINNPENIIFLFVFFFFVFFWYKFIFFLLWYKTKKRLRREERRQSDIKRKKFYALLRDKNFQNHHNYYQNVWAQNIYKKSMLKKDLVSGYKMVFVLICIMSIFMLNDSSNSFTLIDYIYATWWLFAFISIIISISISWDHFKKNFWKTYKIYVMNISKKKEKFIAYSKKIFYY